MADEDVIAIKYSKSLNFTSHYADGSMISTSSKPGETSMVQIGFYETAVDPVEETATKNPDGTYRTSGLNLKVEQTRESRVRITMTQKTANELMVGLQGRLNSSEVADEAND